ncbi:MAG: sulfotransferase [Planctomycetes bacterium]|nr:sulfotransferase [Planctomycetota bacterium]
MAAPAFFVLGVGRSGTSILGYALSLHPRLFVSHELRVLELALLAAALLDRDGEPLEAQPPGYSPLSLAFASAFAEALGAAQLEHEGKPDGVYADKYPPYSSRIGALKALFPAVRFVHILRDGRDVASSAARAFVVDRGWRREREVPGMAALALHWAREVALARREARALGRARYHELRYEDLLARPEQVLGLLLDFLELPRDDSLARMCAVLRPGPDWRTTLSAAELESFDSVEPARALLAELGYPASVAGEANRAVLLREAGLRSLRDLADGPERRAAALALLERSSSAESLFAALHARSDDSPAARAALGRWAHSRGLDSAAAHAVFEVEEATA